MFGIGVPEMVVVLVLALIVLGPKRLPEIAKALGKGLAEFRKVTGDVNRELETARTLIESEARAHEAAKRRSEREAKRKAVESTDANPDTAASGTTEQTPPAPAAKTPDVSVTDLNRSASAGGITADGPEPVSGAEPSSNPAPAASGTAAPAAKA